MKYVGVQYHSGWIPITIIGFREKGKFIEYKDIVHGCGIGEMDSIKINTRFYVYNMWGSPV